MLEGHEMLGVFAYFSLRFNQDKLLMQTIQSFECRYDGYDKHLAHLREKEHVYQSDLFSLKNYSEYSHDVVEYSEELSLAKIQYIKNRIHHQSVEQYYCIIFLRSVCAQQLNRSIYPWVAFEVLIKDKVYLIQMDFLEHFYSEISNGRQKRCTHFAQLEKVTYGFGFDEIIITKNNKAIVYKARYQEQRMFIAEIFRFAMSKDMELKLKNHFINPNDGNFKEQLNEQIDNLRMAQQNYFTLILDDLIIPPPLILCYKGNMNIQSYNNFLCLGVNNIICYDTKIITSVIPYMGESFHIEIFEDLRCLGLHVGKQFNYAYFETKKEAENFRVAILARRKNQFTLEPIYIHFANSRNQQSYHNFKKKKVQQLDELIQQTENKLDKYMELKDQLDMSFVAEELKSAIKKSQIQRISPIQSTIFDFDHTKSLSFQRQLNEQNQFQGPLIDPLQQFAQQFGQQQYQPPMMPGQMPNFQQPPVQQLMGDYEQLRQDVNYMQQQPTQRRPQSRELDLLNLLLIGSMDKGKQSRSGLEGMSQLFSPQGQPQQQFPQFGMPVHPQQQHFANFQQPQGQPFQLPQQQSPYDYASPPSQQIRNTGQLIVNGQMGVQVDQQQQNPYVEQRSNRLLEYVERQNQILAQLTQNIGRKKDEQQAQEKKQLQERLKALEQLNSKDAEINDMYDDMPQYRRPIQHMRPIAPYHPYQPQYPYPPPPPNYYQPQQNIPYY